MKLTLFGSTKYTKQFEVGFNIVKKVSDPLIKRKSLRFTWPGAQDRYILHVYI
jgi:hypothetical protein